MRLLLLTCCLTFATLSGHAQIIKQSLNGYSPDDTNKMIGPFKRLGTQAPQVTCVWFDRSIILNIVDLLNSEVKSRRTDGMRIYFAYSGSKQTVMLVSTQDSGLPNDQSPENDNYHDDYYNHDSSAALFQMKTSKAGEPCYDGINCKNQAILYQTLKSTDTCQYYADNPHYISQSDCQNMVHAFVAQRTNINTRAEWFDLTLLNAFYKMIKANLNVDGVRIYFARHTSQGDALYPDYVDDDAFVIVPTQMIPNSSPAISRQDLFDCSMAVYDPTATESRLRKRIKNRNGFRPEYQFTPFKFHFKPRIAGGGGGGQDNGEMCPNSCN